MSTPLLFAVIVTFCGTFQLESLKVRVAEENRAVGVAKPLLRMKSDTLLSVPGWVLIPTKLPQVTVQW